MMGAILTFSSYGKLRSQTDGRIKIISNDRRRVKKKKDRREQKRMLCLRCERL